METATLFLPAGHVARHTLRACVWKAPEPCVAECWEAHLDELIIEMERRLAFAISCQLHVVVYETNQQARACLGRALPPGMLLAPLLGPGDSVIAVQASAVDEANGDVARMCRHLCHELGHVMVALQTGSEKRLGDGNRLMRVAPWVNEGFAVCVAAIVSGQLDVIERARARAPESATLTQDLDSALDDLGSDQRAAAFSIATMRVWNAIERRGLAGVFAELAGAGAISAWV